MTTKQRLHAMLTDRGMFDSQADKVLADFIPAMNKESNEYNITWDRPADEYPDIMYSLWFQQLKVYALNWLNENAPEAWFKPMFK